MDSYVMGKHLGAGQYGSVNLVQHKLTGHNLVCKKVDLTGREKDDWAAAENEVTMLSRVNNPCVVGCYEAFSQGDCLYIIMEYCDDKDLMEKLDKATKVKAFLPEAEILRLFVQTALGLRHLHKLHLLHRDLKTANIFLTSDGGARLGDLGFTKQVNSTMAVAATVCGTPYYFSPELCLKKPYNNKSDVYSLGVVLYELISLDRPFPAKTMKELVQRVTRTDPNPFTVHHVSQDLQKLAFMMISRDPRDRPSVLEALQQPVVRAYLEKYLGDVSKELAHLNHEIATIVAANPKKPGEVAIAPPSAPAPAPAPTPAADPSMAKAGKFDPNWRKQAAAGGAITATAVAPGMAPPAPIPSGGPTAPGTFKILYQRPLPDAASLISVNAPPAVVTQLAALCMRRENRSALEKDIREVLAAPLDTKRETFAGEAVVDKEEANLRKALGDGKFEEAIEVILTNETTDEATVNMKILAVIGSGNAALIPALRKMAVNFVVE